MKKWVIFLISLVLIASVGVWYQYQYKIIEWLFPAPAPAASPTEEPLPIPPSEPPPDIIPQDSPTPSPSDNAERQRQLELERLKQEMLASLNKEEPKRRLLRVPKKQIAKPAPRPQPEDKFSRSLEKIVAQDPTRAEGIKLRRSFPIGVVIIDNAKLYSSTSKKDAFLRLRTGDIVKLYPEQNEPSLWHIHPGAEIFLAATSKKTEVSGTAYPDKDGWVEKIHIHIFDSVEAKEFTETTDPITLGNDPNFSTVTFYEMAFRNPDPVVHRVIAPRFISILSIHEDYTSSWKEIYRDPDSKIRSVTLAALKQRGVRQSLQIVEDLVARLGELTDKKAQGETEAEALMILNILKESRHPRLPAALSAYVEIWEGSQSPQLVQSLKDTIAAIPPSPATR